MKRKIIKIDEKLCNGCGDCIIGCSEGALQLIDGKAKLVKEDFCDGFGDCVGTCPTGALTIEEREAADFDINGVKNHLEQTQGKKAVMKMEQAQKRHETRKNKPQNHTIPASGGCPGMKMRIKDKSQKPQPNSSGGPSRMIPSELAQWPVQLHLVHPQAPYFKNSELVILSTCSPVASADVHWRYLKGRSVVIACPKLDKTEPYEDKLAMILEETTIPKVIIVRMEVPCCGGLTMITANAVEKSGRKDLKVEEHVISLDGALIETKEMN